MIRWLLVDYGEVLSEPLGDDVVRELAELADLPVAEFERRYWSHRADYDLGCSDERYWSAVLERDLRAEPELVTRLAAVDIHGWLRLNSRTLQVLLAHRRRTGVGPALLSNAPEPLARAVDDCFWSGHLERRYYSCRLGLAKPDPEVFGRVLADLDAEPAEVLFVDDRAENTRAARDLGLHTVDFTSAAALDRELRLLESSPRGVTAPAGPDRRKR